MDKSEPLASAETELREAILSEFLKPELPVPIVLLRHCERYVVKLFDVEAQGLYDLALPSGEFQRGLRNMTHNIPVHFFGCQYEPPGSGIGQRESTAKTTNFFKAAPGCPWGRCIEYAMLAKVDHGVDSRPNEDEFLRRYLDVNGHLFVSYALQTRADFWTSKALRTDSKEGRATETVDDETPQHRVTLRTRTEAWPRVNEPGGSGAQRRAAVDAYIDEVFLRKGKRITRTDIWKSARYKSRTEFERWERDDLRNPNRTAHERFIRILSEKPHLK